MEMQAQATYTSQTGSSTQPMGVFQQTCVGAVTETVSNESRVVMTPAIAREFILNGHTVYIQAGFALQAGFFDEEYKRAGAIILNSAEEVYKKCSVMLKVNPPQQLEYNCAQPQQVIFCFTDMICSNTLSQCLKAMAERRAIVMSYNLLSSSESFPVNNALNEVAGFLAVQQAMKIMELGGCGRLLGEVTGVRGSNVLILGAGAGGMRAAALAAGTGAEVTVMDTCTETLRHINEVLPGVHTVKYTNENVEKLLPTANAVIGAVIPVNSRAPVLLTESQMRLLKPGSIAIDLATRMGGNFQTTMAQNIQKPTYMWNDITMYTASDITCLTPKTTSIVIGQSALSFILQVANKGWKKAVIECASLQEAVCTAESHVTNRFLADLTKSKFMPIEQVIECEIQQLATGSQQNHLVSLKQQLSSFRTQQGIQTSSFTIEA